ncbi:MAG: HDOD domain-containing protein [Desulfobacterales bacterium]
MAGNTTTDAIRERVGRLPLIDVGAFEVIELLNSPNSTYDQVVERLTPDITARFLNLANSAYYGMEVRSIGHAVKLLGYNAMRQNLITSFLIEHFTRHLDFDLFDFEGFQSRSQLAALAARTLGDIMDYRQPGDLYTAAVLHELGELVLAVYFRDVYRRILESAGGPADRRQSEAMHLGCSRFELCAMVLERFNIPRVICDGVRHIDAVGRSMADAVDFELEFILRESVQLAARFPTASAETLNAVGDRLKQTVSVGRAVYRDAVSAQLQKGRYQEGFKSVLAVVSKLAASAIRELLPETAVVETSGRKAAVGMRSHRLGGR